MWSHALVLWGSIHWNSHFSFNHLHTWCLHCTIDTQEKDMKVTISGKISEEGHDVRCQVWGFHRCCKLPKVQCSRSSHHGHVIMTQLVVDRPQLSPEKIWGTWICNMKQATGWYPSSEPFTTTKPLHKTTRSSNRNTTSNVGLQKYVMLIIQ